MALLGADHDYFVFCVTMIYSAKRQKRAWLA